MEPDIHKIKGGYSKELDVDDNVTFLVYFSHKKQEHVDNPIGYFLAYKKEGKWFLDDSNDEVCEPYYIWELPELPYKSSCPK